MGGRRLARRRHESHGHGERRRVWRGNWNLHVPVPRDPQHRRWQVVVAKSWRSMAGADGLHDPGRRANPRLAQWDYHHGHPSYSWTSARHFSFISGSTTPADQRTRSPETYTPAEAGCAAGGTCQVFPNVSLAAGPGKFWVKLSNSSSWSAAMNFTIARVHGLQRPDRAGQRRQRRHTGALWRLLARLSPTTRSRVAFDTGSPLVASDTNATGDVYVHEPFTGQTTLVSIATDGTQGDRVQHVALNLGGRALRRVLLPVDDARDQ